MKEKKDIDRVTEKIIRVVEYVPGNSEVEIKKKSAYQGLLNLATT